MPVYAQSILVCDFNGTEPSLHTPWTLTSYLDPNISYSGWRLGQGAIPTTPGVNNALAFYFKFHRRRQQPRRGLRDKEYVYFSIQPTTGTLNLSGKKVNFDIQRIDWFAPRTYAVFTSVAGFTVGSQIFTTASLDNGDYTNHSYSFIIPPTGYDGLTSPVEFRIYGYQAKYDSHDTSLTAFSIEQAAPIHTLNLTSGSGGHSIIKSAGNIFRAGDNDTAYRLSKCRLSFRRLVRRYKRSGQSSNHYSRRKSEYHSQFRSQSCAANDNRYESRRHRGLVNRLGLR